jgi:hypothetical protein
MWDRFDKVVSNDVVVKLVFDHIRNLALSALVIGAGKWRISHISESWVGYLDIGTGAVLFVVGGALYFLNQLHGQAKIREIGTPFWLELLFITIYAFVAVMVVLAILSRPV